MSDPKVNVLIEIKSELAELRSFISDLANLRKQVADVQRAAADARPLIDAAFEAKPITTAAAAADTFRKALAAAYGPAAGATQQAAQIAAVRRQLDDARDAALRARPAIAAVTAAPQEQAGPSTAQSSGQQVANFRELRKEVEDLVKSATKLREVRVQVLGVSEAARVAQQSQSGLAAISARMDEMHRKVSGLREVRQEVQNVARAVQAAGSSGGGLGALLKVIPGGGLMGGLVGGISGGASFALIQGAMDLVKKLASTMRELAQSGIEYNVVLEQHEVGFTTLLHSATAARGRLEELKKFDAETPFNLEEITQTSRMLEAFGGAALSTGDGLRMVGDTAAGTSRPIGELSMWMGRLYAGLESGTPVGEATQRLLELTALTGPQARKLNELAESGKAVGKAFKVMSEEFGRFEGAMYLQSKTAQGISNQVTASIKDDMGRLTKWWVTMKKEMQEAYLSIRGEMPSAYQGAEKGARAENNLRIGDLKERLAKAAGNAKELSDLELEIAVEYERMKGQNERETPYLLHYRKRLTEGRGGPEWDKRADELEKDMPASERLPRDHVSAAAYRLRAGRLGPNLDMEETLARMLQEAKTERTKAATANEFPFRPLDVANEKQATEWNEKNAAQIRDQNRALEERRLSLEQQLEIEEQRIRQLTEAKFLADQFASGPEEAKMLNLQADHGIAVAEARAEALRGQITQEDEVVKKLREQTEELRRRQQPLAEQKAAEEARIVRLGEEQELAITGAKTTAEARKIAAQYDQEIEQARQRVLEIEKQINSEHEREAKLARQRALDVANLDAEIRLGDVQNQQADVQAAWDISEREKRTERIRLMQVEVGVLEDHIRKLEELRDAAPDEERGTYDSQIVSGRNRIGSLRVGMRQQGPDPESVGEQTRYQFEQLQNQLATFSENMGVMLMSPIAGFRDGFASALDDLLAKGATAGEFFGNIARGISTSMRQAFVKMATDYISQHVVMKGVALAWNGFLKLLRWAGVIDENAAEKAKMAPKAANATLSSISSFGVAAAIGVAAIAGILAAMGAFAEGGLTPGTKTLAWVGEEGPELVIPANATARFNRAQQAMLMKGQLPAIPMPMEIPAADAAALRPSLGIMDVSRAPGAPASGPARGGSIFGSETQPQKQVHFHYWNRAQMIADSRDEIGAIFHELQRSQS